VTGAGLEQGALVGEVAVDGQTLNAGTLCDRADRRLESDRIVELDGRLDDPLPRRRLALGSLLEFVFPRHRFTRRPSRLTP